MLATLIRIRKTTVEAICSWDLDNRRPEGLTVLDTEENLTGLTRDQVMERFSGQ